MHAPTTPRPRRAEDGPPSPADKNPLTYNLITVCPECAGPILRGSSCMACAHCGWGRCQ
jgi:hypothetical protein